jgi:hypothetical protein
VKKKLKIRKFETGATRDTDHGKYVYGGFQSPAVVERFAAYMHKHRTQADGTLRAANNWKKGIPKDAFFESLHRHFMDLWKLHQGMKVKDDVEDLLCAILFNAQGYLFEKLQDRGAAEKRPV